MRDRILMLAGSYYPAIGGGELLNARHAQLLRAAGFDVRVVTAGPRAAALATDASGTPFEIVEGRNFAGFSVVPAAAIERSIEAFAPTLIYCAGPEPHDLSAVRAATRRRLPCALLYHADFRSDRLPSRLATRAYARYVARRFGATIVTTQAYRQRLVGRGLDPRRVTCVGMGVDTEFFTPPPAPRSHDRARLLFVGRLDANHTYKRLDLLLQANAELLRRGIAVDLTVIGEGDRREAFERLARELGTPNATFAGAVDDTRLRLAYREHDLLVLPSPSPSEGFGLVVLEAYACGCPVVANAAAGCSEAVAASGVGALWKGADAPALAAAIESALHDERSRAEIAARARAYAVAGHAWSSVGERLSAALCELLGAGKRVPAARIEGGHA
ncbi:MAG TPA: glycosyltransferase family 4 protein [Candidatus Acidoferrales bacterium]|nr:glycosyltransferase family 4 protein [Candidatus Acidoferrales bacterium]